MRDGANDSSAIDEGRNVQVITPQPPRIGEPELEELADELRALIEQARRRARRRRRFYAALVIAAVAAGAAALLHDGGDAGLGRSVADASRPSAAASAKTRGWGASHGPAGGSITSLAVAPHAVYAGTIGSGIFKSTDHGRSWRAVNSHETALQRVDALAVDPVRPRTVYAGTGGGVFKSTDGGRTWRRTNAGLFRDPYRDSRSHRLVEGYIGTLAVDPRRPRTVYAGAYRSLDAGHNWRRLVLPGGEAVQQAVFAPSNPSIVLGTSGDAFGDHLVRSTDGGRTWHRLSFDASRYQGLLLAVDAHDANRVYVASGGLSTSVDGGRSWRRLNGPFGKQVYGFALDPAASGTIYVASAAGLFRSVDDGAGWRPLELGLAQDEPVWAVWVDRRLPRIVYASTGGRLLRSLDAGVTWSAAAGFTASSVSELTTSGGTLYAATGTSGLWRSTNGGRTWSSLETGAAALAVATDPILEHTLYVGTERAGVLESRDDGQTWQPANTGLTARRVLDLAADTERGTLYAGTWGGGLYTSDDHGSSWRRTPVQARTFTLAVAHGVAYVGTGNGGVWRSVGGGPWERRGHVCCGRISALQGDPAHPGVVFAGNGFGLFRSTDGGATWGRSGPGGQIEAIAVDPAEPSTVFAGRWSPSGGGVLRSGDGGLTWSRFDVGLETRGVGAFAFSPDGRRLYAGTIGNGVAARTLAAGRP
jgi:photosystem II stability/assembly factor-like uncharacterized protein